MKIRFKCIKVLNQLRDFVPLRIKLNSFGYLKLNSDILKGYIKL